MATAKRGGKRRGSGNGRGDHDAPLSDAQERVFAALVADLERQEDAERKFLASLAELMHPSRHTTFHPSTSTSAAAAAGESSFSSRLGGASSSSSSSPLLLDLDDTSSAALSSTALVSINALVVGDEGGSSSSISSGSSFGGCDAGLQKRVRVVVSQGSTIAQLRTAISDALQEDGFVESVRKRQAASYPQWILPGMAKQQQQQQQQLQTQIQRRAHTLTMGETNTSSSMASFPPPSSLSPSSGGSESVFPLTLPLALTLFSPENVLLASSDALVSSIPIRTAMEKLLIKLDIRSCRVKAVSFHPTLPWILCGMHSGAIQIWDYRMNTSVGTYEEHVGSVRGVDFHNSQPLFVSGADDYLIKVWNYQLSRCLFTLEGHMDYIRCTFFHHQQPWILSCSDDFTVRIWNWQNRGLVASLPGHNHYVLCAKFHPVQDLIVSASLDTTIRVWDISALRGSHQKTGLTQDLLGSSDVILRYQLDGHEMGVNWATFHPTKPLIISASDDRTVRTWRMTDTSCREEMQLRGHTNNVCCVDFYKDFIISNSEDRTIRVWDQGSRSALMVFRRDADRYWILAVHPTNNLIAAGHDSGVQVFKIFRERPAWTTHNDVLYFCREQALYSYNFATGNKEKHMTLRASQAPAVSISCSSADDTAAVCYNVEGGLQTFFTLPRQGSAASTDIKKAYFTDAVFFSANKFAFVDKYNKVLARVTRSENTTELATTFKCLRVFPGPMGYIVCRSIDEKVYLYHVAQQCAVAEATVTDVRYVMWNKDYRKVAFLSKNSITVLNKAFHPVTVILESTVRVKSAVFDENEEVLYYATANHLKYCNLRNGECSTIHTLKAPIYLVRAQGNKIWFITRAGDVVAQTLDNTELNFKMMLQKKSYREVLRIIQQKKLKGQALVGYLYKHGHSEIALHFVSDPMTRFNLAVECGAMDIAKKTAGEINKAEVWRRLAESATRFGDIQLAQLANGKINNYYGMGMQCLLTHNMALLEKMVETSKDRNFKIHYSLFTNDVMQRVKTLKEAGQLPLAYAAAKSNGLEEEAAALLEEMEPAVAERAMQIPLHKPLKQVHVEPLLDNWPMLQVEESVFSRVLRDPSWVETTIAPVAEDVEVGSGWDSDNDINVGAKGSDAGEEGGMADERDGWDDELEIAPNALSAAAAATQKGVFVVPSQGMSVQQYWLDTYDFAPYHIVCGSFETAYMILKRQIGLVNPEPLHPYMMNMYLSVTAIQPTWLGQSTLFPLTTQALSMNGLHAPMIPDPLPALGETMRQAANAFVLAHFAEAHAMYLSILRQIAITPVQDESALYDLNDLLKSASEYVQALNVQLKLRSLPKDSREVAELAIYFATFDLSTYHKRLALHQAMIKAYKKGASKSAVLMARRLLENDPTTKQTVEANTIINNVGSDPVDSEPINYDPLIGFQLCSVDMKPLYKGKSSVIFCSYCNTPADAKYRGKECLSCGIAAYGVETSGRVNGLFQRK